MKPPYILISKTQIMFLGLDSILQRYINWTQTSLVTLSSLTNTLDKKPPYKTQQNKKSYSNTESILNIESDGDRVVSIWQVIAVPWFLDIADSTLWSGPDCWLVSVVSDSVVSTSSSSSSSGIRCRSFPTAYYAKRLNINQRTDSRRYLASIESSQTRCHGARKQAWKCQHLLAK